jgi:hypothetical protein
MQGVQSLSLDLAAIELQPMLVRFFLDTLSASKHTIKAPSNGTIVNYPSSHGIVHSHDCLQSSTQGANSSTEMESGDWSTLVGPSEH